MLSSIALLRDHLGPSMAKALATAVLQAPVISDPLIDFLKERLKGEDEAKQAERQINRLVEQSLAPLTPMFSSAKGVNPEAVAITLGETVEQHVDVKALIASDLDRTLVHDQVMAARPLEDLEAEAYATADIELYRRALPVILDRLIDIAPKLEGFAGASTAEILRRLTKLAQEKDAIKSGIERLHQRFDNVIRFEREEERNYTIDYCAHIDKHLNAIQLFGITTEAAASQQKLSTAFIPLSLARERNEKSQRGSTYFASLLERLSPENPRLLITGPAGSGKTTLLKWAAIQAAEMIKIGVEKTSEWEIDERLGSTIRAMTEVFLRARRQRNAWDCGKIRLLSTMLPSS